MRLDGDDRLLNGCKYGVMPRSYGLIMFCSIAVS